MGYSQPRRIEEQVARELLLALVLLGVVLAQTTLLPRPLQAAPHLLLLLVITRALIAGPSNAARWAFYGGLWMDICANSVLGSHALALLVAVLCASLPLARLRRDNWLLPLFGALFGTIGYTLMLALLTRLLVGAIEPQRYLLVVIVPEILASLVPILPLYLLMRWREQRRRGEVPIDVY